MSVHTPGTRWYNSVWRWHFYAGLTCIPFVIWLALTGSIYLWRPQIEGWLDRRFDHLPVSGPVTALFLILLAVTGAVLWWRRRPIGLLGAPMPLSRPHFGPLLIGVMVGLGLYLPMFGPSLLAMLLLERLTLRRIAGARRWLGLSALREPIRS